MSRQPRTSQIEIRRFEPPDHPVLRAIIERAWNAGELAGHAPHEIERLIESLADDPHATYVAHAGGEIAGVLTATWDLVIVSPEWRRQRIGTALVRAALADRPNLELALPPGSVTAEPFLRAVGFALDHYLRRMVLRADAKTQPVRLPDGFVLLPYDERHFDRYFRLLNGAFADHPTPIQVSEARMRTVHSSPDFDSSLLALIARSNAPDELVAFTFLRSRRLEDDGLHGSIGMIGVDRAYRRLGLGRQLLRWGVIRLKEAGCTTISLEVVDNNDRALPLYESEGFTPAESWPFWTYRGEAGTDDSA